MQETYNCHCLTCDDHEDWDAEETNNKRETDERRTGIRRVLNVRDRLNCVLDLLTLCHDSLSNSELISIKETVAHVLYFQVQEQIKIAEKELASLCQSE